MILDNFEKLSDGQALSSGTVKSTNYKNFGADRNVGIGEPLAVVISVDTAAATASGSGTFTFELESDSVNTFASPTVFISRTIAGSLLTAGSLHVLPIPADTVTEQYLEGKWTLAGDTPTVTISAYIIPQKAIQGHVVYPAGTSVGS